MFPTDIWKFWQQKTLRLGDERQGFPNDFVQGLTDTTSGHLGARTLRPLQTLRALRTGSW